MSLLAHKELLQLISDGVISALPENVNAASIDVRLGTQFVVEEGHRGLMVDLFEKEMPAMRIVEGDSFVLHPGEFALAHTIERFNLPDDLSCWFTLKSSAARAGLDHSEAGWAEAGFHGANLTMELRNNLRGHPLKLRAGMKIGQMVFFRHKPAGEGSYKIKGQYNGGLGVNRKGVR